MIPRGPSPLTMAAAGGLPLLRRAMEQEYCRLRSDLEIRRESSDPGSPVIIKDPITRRFYRFTAVQAAVQNLLDGSHSAASVAGIVSSSFQTEVKEEQVQAFAEKLRGLLLLDHPSCWAQLNKSKQARKSWLRSLLSIKIHAVNPDPLITVLSQRMGFFYGEAFAVVVWLAVGTAVIISILNRESLFLSLGTLVSLYSLPLIFLVAFAVMTIHEFAHGLTLKHFGGRVEEMGLLVLYFIPAFYCNLDDAWMLRRRERMLVTLAGGYIQLFLWACATIAWRLIAPETILSRVCLVIIGFAGVQALFNFNPLIRLDGYYLLSDYLEIPNLRPKAWAYLSRKLKAFFLSDEAPVRSTAGSRERRIFWIYGTSSFLFSAGLLCFMYERLAAWLVRELQTWGMILAAAMIIAAVPMGRKEPHDADSQPHKEKPPGFRLTKKHRWLIVLGLLIVAGFFPWELKISGDFTIVPNRHVSVSPEVEGLLVTINVDEGQRVRAGDILAEMDNLELNNDYKDTSGELATQEATLRLLKAGARPEEIDRARKLVETKKAELETAGKVEQELKMLAETVAKKEFEARNAEENNRRTQRLFKEGLVSKTDSERDQTNYDVLLKDLSSAKGQLKVLEERTDSAKHVKVKELAQAESELRIQLAGTREETIQAMEAEVKKLEEKKSNLAQQLECLRIKSPIEGIVATPHLKNRIGQYLNKGDALCEIVSEGRVIIDMPVPEKEIADVRPGLTITLKVRGYPSRSFEAKVKTLAPVAIDRGAERTVVVQGELENLDGSLRAGMTGVGKILCGKRMIAYLVSRRALRWLRTEFWEYLP